MSKDKTETKFPAIEQIVTEIAFERVAQDEKWGEQNHPSSYSETTIRQAQRQADHWKQVNDARVAEGTISWDGILLEEVYEALAEKDDQLRRAELVQVAAVAAAEIEAIDRRAARQPDPEPEAPAIEVEEDAA